MKTLQFCLPPFSLSFTEVPSIFLLIFKHFIHGQSVSDTESNTIPRFEIDRSIVWMIDIFIYRSFGVYDWFAAFEEVMSLGIKQLLEWLSSCLGFNSRFYSHKLDSRSVSRTARAIIYDVPKAVSHTVFYCHNNYSYKY